MRDYYTDTVGDIQRFSGNCLNMAINNYNLKYPNAGATTLILRKMRDPQQFHNAQVSQNNCLNKLSNETKRVSKFGILIAYKTQQAMKDNLNMKSEQQQSSNKGLTC